MKFEKTKNTIRNSIWGMVDKCISMIGPFLTRTVIIYVFGAEYAGLDSLFTSILSILSLTELGFGSAIIYSMYEPIAREDKEKLCALMNFYRIVYRYMGIIVLIIGIVLIPFLNSFIKGNPPDTINIYVLYVIYLFGAVVSYWLFAYENSLLTAFQRTDIQSKMRTVIKILLYAFQIFFILNFEQYYLYVACIPVSNIILNIITAIRTRKLYPDYIPSGKLHREDIISIKKQVGGLLAERLAKASRNSFDAIVLSTFLGLTISGIYNNYFCIINAITGILAIIFESMRGGLGNSLYTESDLKNYADLNKVNFMYLWISGLCSILFLVLIQPFMKMWLGERLMFSNVTAALLALYFYLMKMTDTTGAYVSATGIWWKCKKVYIIEMATNLILNVFLVVMLGVDGIILATMISVFFVDFLLVTKILFSNIFKDFSLKRYYLKNLMYLGVTAINGILCMVICNMIIKISGCTGVFELLVRFITCILVSNVVYYIFYCRTEQFRNTKCWIVCKIRNRRMIE